MRRSVAWPWLAALALAFVFVACHDDEHDDDASAPAVGGARAGTSSRGGQAGEPTSADGGAVSSEGGSPIMGGGGAGNHSAGEGGSAGDLGGASAGSGSSGEAGTPALDLHHPAYPPSPYPAENPDSDAKALLGKILFWDEQLSGDDTVACGTCHRPNAGGSDPRATLPAAAQAGADGLLGTDDDVHGSLGVVRCNAQGQHTGQSVQVTARKAPTYLDAMLSGRLFWDGRAQCAHDGCPSFSAFEDPDQPGTFPIHSGGALENQAVGPPLSPVEMACEDATWPKLHQKLASRPPLGLAKQVPSALADFIAAHDASYPKLFQAAFGTAQTSGPADEINTRRIAFAIATHERRLRSDQTPWDRWNAGEDAALTPGQLRGFRVFMTKARCEQCHRAPGFTDNDFHFIGFHEPSWDMGRKSVNPEFGVPGAMRTPTLRNVGLRSATGLLHNGAGRGASLARIIDTYDQGGLVDDDAVTTTPIDPIIVPLGLTPDEKSDLLDFLEHGLDDPRVQAQTSPFDRPLLSTE
jgi:cytochrome c peroxidase